MLQTTCEPTQKLSNVGFINSSCLEEVQLNKPVVDISFDCQGAPTKRWYKIKGPVDGLRVIKQGFPDFFSISEISKSIDTQGMCDEDKARAVYRFCRKYIYNMHLGFGSYEMNRFINGFGYSWCWGQHDVNHLLYESKGLQARMPKLKGHAATEVLLDGKWCSFDAYSYNLHPCPDLSRPATGSELKAHPELFKGAWPDEKAEHYDSVWEGHDPSTQTYEAWSDSRSMTINLRRGEEILFEEDKRVDWCISPQEPFDHTNGTWAWKPLIDAEHLEKEIAQQVGLTYLEKEKCIRPLDEQGWMEYHIPCPYPLLSGQIEMHLEGGLLPQCLEVSTDARKTWTTLEVKDHNIAIPKPLLSVRDVEAGCSPAKLEHGAVHDLYIRFAIGDAGLKSIAFSLQFQAHARTLPFQDRGENSYRIVGAVSDLASFSYGHDLSPEFTVSNAQPYEGDEVSLSVMIHNQNPHALHHVPVKFSQVGTQEELGLCILEVIPPHSAKVAKIKWCAKATGDRARKRGYGPRRYVHSHIQAEILNTNGCETLSHRAETRMLVRPRPKPQTSIERFKCLKSGSKHIVRLALANFPDELTKWNYKEDSPLNATIELQDQNGNSIDRKLKINDVGIGEYKVAEWTELDLNSLKGQKIKTIVTCDQNVLEEFRMISLECEVPE